MSTPNLAIPHILPSQAQKEVTANAAFDALDQAIAGLLEADVSAGGTVTVDPVAALKCKMLRFTGTLAADAEVVVPDNREALVSVAEVPGVSTSSRGIVMSSAHDATAGSTTVPSPSACMALIIRNAPGRLLIVAICGIGGAPSCGPHQLRGDYPLQTLTQNLVRHPALTLLL